MANKFYGRCQINISITTGADPEMVEEEILKEICLLIHKTTRVHIKTRQTCNSFSQSSSFSRGLSSIFCFLLLLSLSFEI